MTSTWWSLSLSLRTWVSFTFSTALTGVNFRKIIILWIPHIITSETQSLIANVSRSVHECLLMSTLAQIHFKHINHSILLVSWKQGLKGKGIKGRQKSLSCVRSRIEEKGAGTCEVSIKNIGLEDLSSKNRFYTIPIWMLGDLAQSPFILRTQFYL